MQARPHTRWEETAGPTDNPVMHPAPEPAFVIRFRPEKGKPWNDQQVRQRALSRNGNLTGQHTCRTVWPCTTKRADSGSRP